MKTIAASLILAVSVLLASKWEMTAHDGQAYRLNRWTGEVVMCVPDYKGYTSPGYHGAVLFNCNADYSLATAVPAISALTPHATSDFQLPTFDDVLKQQAPTPPSP